MSEEKEREKEGVEEEEFTSDLSADTIHDEAKEVDPNEEIIGLKKTSIEEQYNQQAPLPPSPPTWRFPCVASRLLRC